MKHRQPSSPWVLWLCAMALLLKAAMPLLASASAHLQRKPLVEVCTVYGVAQMPSAAAHADQAAHAGHDGHDGGPADADAASHGHAGLHTHADAGAEPGPDTRHAAGHGGDHCALTALAVLALPDHALPSLTAAPLAAAAAAGADRRLDAADACAVWMARHHHGPPTRA